MPVEWSPLTAMKHLLSLVGRVIYWLMGWRFTPLPAYFNTKHVIIGFPHTSNMDTVRAFTGFRIVKKTGHIMIKKEWFWWPMSVGLRWLGGVPVDRAAPAGVVRQMVRYFRERDEFLLAIVPEGTRKGVHTIKTGFWHIAKEADVSIICWYLDNEQRCTRWLGEVVPGDSMKDDLLHIQDLYAEAGYRFPLDIAKL
jgi:1-acyl-sn-glycerol-3-phosphate acyltransferase